MISSYRRYRLYEMLPGGLIWGFFIILSVLSFVKPLWVIYFIIMFDIYWVFRVVYFSIFLIMGWRKFKKTSKINWEEKLSKIKERNSVYHLIFLPIYDEDYEVLKTTLDNIILGTYSTEKMMIVLAGEESKKSHFEEITKKVKQEYDGKFHSLIITLHPKGRGDEIPGKGSNIHYAGLESKKIIDKLGIKYENVIASAFDVDTIIHPQYFSYLSHEYLTCEDPTHTSFQPVALYNNNMWESQSFIRIMAFGTTFWLLFALTRPDMLVTFSSHSMSFKALVDVGFWQKDIVSEDSRIFWQCLIYYKGNYKTHPLYTPVSMDTVRDDKWYISLVNIYKQQRRWAWGTENIPYLLWHFRRLKKEGTQIPFFKKIRFLFNQIEGKFSWGTTAITLLVFGRLPLWVAGDNIKQTALFQNTPHILEMFMNLALLGILVSLVLSLPLLPPPPTPAKNSLKHKLPMVFQWILLPVSLLLVSAIPAIDAQTRLMFGKYLGFNVSQKKRVSWENK